MNPEDDFLLGPMGTPSTVGDFASDFARGVKFSPFDLLGALRVPFLARMI